jgi:hypothetical protein
MRGIIVATGLLWCVSASANLTISYINLNPKKATSSVAYAINGTNQAGYATFDGHPHAVVWSGSADLFQDFQPSGAVASTIYALTATNQAGYATFGNTNDGFYDNAMLWSGSAASAVNLNPAGALNSCAYAASGTNQGGYAQFENEGEIVTHAALWSGTFASFVDLNPPIGSGNSIIYDSGYSIIYGMTDSIQVGVAQGEIQSGAYTAILASMWNGTANSFTSLNPPGDFIDYSIATCASGSREFGGTWYNTPYTADYIAVGWRGSLQVVDLHPFGSYVSMVNATTGPLQAGLLAQYTQLDYNRVLTYYYPRAALWFGTAKSYVDLNAVLGSAFKNSVALGIWTSGNPYNVLGGSTTYVVGYATEAVSGRQDAIMWIIQNNITWPLPYLNPPTPALNGLNLFSSTNSGDQNQRGSLALVNTFGNGWLEVPNPVTYSATITNYPGTNNPNYQTHIFLIPGTPPAIETAPDFDEPDLIFLDIHNNADGTAYAAFRYKINQPTNEDIYGPDNGTSGTLAVLNASSIIGSWSMSFNNDTNVTLYGPGGVSTNFSISSSVAEQFVDPLTVYVGSQPNSAANIGQSVVLSDFSITGNDAPVNDNFATDASLDLTTWQTVVGDPTTIQLVPPGSSWWLSWNLPDSGFYLQTTSNLSGTNGWTALTGPNSNAGPFGSLSTGSQRMLLLPATNMNARANYFRLAQQPFVQLQVLLPGETAAPGTPTGKTGTPLTQTVGVPFPITVNAVDTNWVVMTLVTDTVDLSCTDTTATIDPDAALVNGTGTFNVTFGTDGQFTITGTDTSDNTKAINTSSSVSVDP